MARLLRRASEVFGWTSPAEQERRVCAEIRQAHREIQHLDKEFVTAFAEAWQIRADHFPELPLNPGNCLDPELVSIFSDDRTLEMYEDRRQSLYILIVGCT